MDSTQLQHMPDGSWQLVQTVIVSSFTVESLTADIETLKKNLADKQDLLVRISGT